MKALRKKLLIVAFSIYLFCNLIFTVLNWEGGWFDEPKIIDLREPIVVIVAISLIVGVFFLVYCAFHGFVNIIENIED